MNAGTTGNIPPGGRDGVQRLPVRELPEILRPLKDGYYLVLSMPLGGRVAEGLHRSELTQHRLDREL